MESEFKIDDLLVWGYLRAIELLCHMTVPNEIYDMIYLYQKVCEYFAECGAGIKILEDKMTINFITRTSNYTAYGVVRIPSYQNNKKYIWNMKVNNIASDGGGLICVGIVDAKQNRLWTQFQTDSCPLYSVESETESGCLVKWDKNGSEDTTVTIANGDVLHMILDMKEKTVQFMVNGKDEGVIFKDVEQKKDLEYKLAVTMKRTDTSVTFKDFQVIHQK